MKASNFLSKLEKHGTGAVPLPLEAVETGKKDDYRNAIVV
jgi:hypothetical protein